MESLFKSNTVSARQHDEARSEMELAQAALANAQAARRTATINLGYTRVVAPIGGVTGLQAISPGNLVEPGALLTTRSAAHTSELQSLMRIPYAVFCLKK